jgi:hypothetical protein
LYTFHNLIVLSVVRRDWNRGKGRFEKFEEEWGIDGIAITVGGEEEVRVVVGGAPFDFVDLLLDFQTLNVDGPKMSLYG